MSRHSTPYVGDEPCDLCDKPSIVGWGSTVQPLCLHHLQEALGAVKNLWGMIPGLIQEEVSDG